ncbi:CHY zinc finger protein [Gammaproteobacteria bacterium]|nr:CHY zinc finger protein [Gammaproteobacteria bacterium]
MQVQVKGETVFGAGIDAQTRCKHYRTDLDVVAIRFYCCERWYACHDCHVAIANHATEVWPRRLWEQQAILCGVCGHRLSVHQYLESNSVCPSCTAHFNPGCQLHHHMYFESSK